MPGPSTVSPRKLLNAFPRSMSGSVAALRRQPGPGRGGGMTRCRQAAHVRQDRPFKGRQFSAEVILWAVRWYLKGQIWRHSCIRRI